MHDIDITQKDWYCKTFDISSRYALISDSSDRVMFRVLSNRVLHMVLGPFLVFQFHLIYVSCKINVVGDIGITEKDWSADIVKHLISPPISFI